MPHITLDPDLPGIRSLAAYRPETGRSLYELADALLGEQSSLSRAESELIAAYVSAQNACHFCMASHAAASRHLYGEQAATVDAIARSSAIHKIVPSARSVTSLHLRRCSVAGRPLM